MGTDSLAHDDASHVTYRVMAGQAAENRLAKVPVEGPRKVPDIKSMRMTFLKVLKQTKDYIKHQMTTSCTGVHFNHSGLGWYLSREHQERLPTIIRFQLT
jgi:hypothetical protein